MATMRWKQRAASAVSWNRPGQAQALKVSYGYATQEGNVSCEPVTMCFTDLAALSTLTMLVGCVIQRYIAS